MKHYNMKIAIHKDDHVEGLVPLKVNPINADGDISLLFNREDGFSIAEVASAISQYFVCSLCNGSIGAEAQYRSEKPPKIALASVLGGVPVYTLERTDGSIYYRWRCLGDNGIECTATYGWREEIPPVFKLELKLGGDTCAGNTRSP